MNLQSQKIISMGIVTLQFLINLPVGLTLLLLVLKSPELRKCQHNVLIGNIMAAELALLAALFVGSALILHDHEESISCKIVGFITYLPGLSAWFSYVLLAIERYLELVQNQVFLKMFSARNIRFILTATWIFPGIQLLPFAITADESLGFEELQLCGVSVASSHWKQIYYWIVIMGTPLTCHAVTMRYNLRIWYLLRLHRRKAMTSSSTTQQSNQQGASMVMHTTPRDFDAVSKLLFVNCVLPMLFQMPLALAKGVAPYITDPLVFRILSILYLVPPMLNPYIALHYLKSYRVAVFCCIFRGCGIKIGESESTAPPAPTNRDARNPTFF